MSKKLDEAIHSVVENMLTPKTWTSSKSVDKQQGSGRNRSSGAKAYPVPWSIEPIEESNEDNKHTGFFIALVLPGDIAEMIAIPGGQPPDNLHVTLFYSKDGTLSQRIKAAEEIRGLLMNVLPLEAKLGGIGRFTGGSTSDGKDVIYLHFVSPQILDYRKAIEEAAMRNGIQPDITHGFVPHVTIAYVNANEPTPFNRLKQQIELTIVQPKIVLGKPEILDPAMVSEVGPPPIPPQAAIDKNKGSVDEKLGRIVLKKYSQNMARRGIHIQPSATLLGVGSRGAAFDAGGDKVLKITGDKSEAIAANRLKGKNNKHIYNVFDVFQIKGLDVFGILQEKLEQLPGSEGRKPGKYDGPAGALTDAIIMTEFPNVVFNASSWDEVLNKMQARANAKLKKMDPQQRDEFKKYFAESIHIMNFYNMKGMFEELKQLGISFKDYHAGNIFRRPGTKEFVIGDIGFSGIAGGQMPDVLEKTIKEQPTKKSEEPSDFFLDNLELAKKNAISLHKKFGINVDTMKSLGHGMMGEAFDIGHSKVLKITKDKTEAVASFSIKGKDYKHIVRIFEVFQFKNSDRYGIIQEKLLKLSSAEKNEVAEFYDFCDDYGIIGYLYAWNTKAAFGTVERLAKTREDANRFFELVDKLDIQEWFIDLKAAGIHFLDFHEQNVMKKHDGTIALIDLGVSKTDKPSEPPFLEKKIVETVVNSLTEAVADSVCVTIGTFQPFHKNQAKVIRDLAKKYSKVIIFLTGIKQEKNSFSFNLMKDLMWKSLPDISSKIEIYKAEINGKETNDIPLLINRIVVNFNSSLEPGITANIVVEPNMVDIVKKQVASSKNKLDGFNPSLFVVQSFSALANDSNTEKLSKQSFFDTLKSNNKDAVKKLVDAHLLTDENSFDELYDRMKKEIGIEEVKIKEVKIKEAISDLKDGEGSIFRTLEANRERLLKKNIKTWTRLGSGKMGTAFDVGANKVIKVTTDNKEARISNGLKGKNNQHIVKIFDVFKFDEKVFKDKVPMYGIIQEKLEPLSQQEHDEFNILKDAWWDDRVIDTFATKSFNEIVVKMRRVWFEELLRDLGHPIPESMSDKELEGFLGKISAKNARFAKAIANAHKHINENEKLMIKYQVDKIVSELRTNGIEFADLKSENLMKKGQNYVVVDLGMSNGTNAIEPPVLEQMIIKAVIEAGVPASPTSFASPSARVQSSPWSSGNTLEPKEDEIEDTGHEQLQQVSRKPKFE